MSKPERNVRPDCSRHRVGEPGQVALRFPVSLLTHFVLRQRLGDVCPDKTCSAASAPCRCQLSHTPSSLRLSGAPLHITAWFCGSAWLVADQGLVLTMFRVTRTVEGHRDTMHPESLVFTTRAGCPFRPDPPQSLFKWKICKSTSASMRSTIWLTAVSGKRNNQIIIQSWVFNSRKASGC